MAGWVKTNITVSPAKLRLCLQDGKYERYALTIGHKIREAAIKVFETHQRADNEWRLSHWTPPKYISSFRTEFYRKTLTTRVANDDPGWALVEFGFHPGGNSAYVTAMKPLRRGLLIMSQGV